MSKIKVAVAVVDAPLPAGAALFSVVLVAVIDAAGTEQTARLNGQEDQPFATVFEVADGAGQIKACALDQDEKVIEGSEITQSFSAGVVPAAPDAPPVDESPAMPPEPVASFKQPIGVIVTPVEG